MGGLLYTWRRERESKPSLQFCIFPLWIHCSCGFRVIRGAVLGHRFRHSDLYSQQRDSPRMSKLPRYLTIRKLGFYPVIEMPKHVSPLFDMKPRFLQSLQTRDQRLAER